MLETILRGTVALALGAVVTFLVANGLADYRQPVPVTPAELEPALAAVDDPGVRLPEVDRGQIPIREGRARVDVTIPAEECLFAIVGAATAVALEQVALFDSGAQEPLVWERDARTAGLGWCAGAEDRPVTLWATAAQPAEEPESILYRFHRGPAVAEWRRYVVGQTDPQELRRLTDELDRLQGELRDRERAPSGEVLFRTDVGSEVAFAVPLSESTRWAARAIGTVGAPDAGYAPQLHGVAGSVGSQRPLARVDDALRRLLLVVDPADLPMEGPVPCVTVHFARLAGEPRPITRVTLPDLRAETLEEHRLCPGDPLTAFVTSRTDPAPWRIRIALAEGPAAPARRATPIPGGDLVAWAHTEALERCEAGDAAQCTRVAQHYAVGRHVPADPAAALRYAQRACRADAAECGVYGDQLAEDGQLTAAVAQWERGCTASDGWACVRLGEARRLGEGTPFDAAEAYRLYRTACEMGIGDGCRRAATMTELELAP